MDLEAVAVGHDLSRGTAAFRRVVRTEPALTPPSHHGPDGGSEGAPGGTTDVSFAVREKVAVS
ncbi:Single-stranded DNA-binding protein 1 OS=Streptomyces microflavus OX=1919 GN=ssb1 PE=4 SV=1 [Streptomyces microflavus]